MKKRGLRSLIQLNPERSHQLIITITIHVVASSSTHPSLRPSTHPSNSFISRRAIRGGGGAALLRRGRQLRLELVVLRELPLDHIAEVDA